ncbi:MAG: hypothetical protein NC344_11445 [Bacteroidales bacterium]|nr:hypothetical protein [Bacteroidales bacterium]MCM1148420.1 hypothetical protein [Bacteroidales bacterium]MCM1207274.1 hypothetical protein [Bacillota bacterium]MCM1511497.1 hypothetical protein [Clostridium sp.]
MTRQEIQQLIEKYDDGRTTCTEEAAMRKYFRSLPDNDMPQEWRAYKMMFAFIDSKQSLAQEPAARPRRKSRLTLYIRMASAAACIAAAIIIMLPKATSEEGYAVLDGKRVTSSRVVRAEAEAALQMVAYTDDEAFGALGDL